MPSQFVPKNARAGRAPQIITTTRANYGAPYEEGRVPGFLYVGFSRTTVTDIKQAVTRHKLGAKAVSDCDSRWLYQKVREVAIRHLTWKCGTDPPRWQNVDGLIQHKMISELEDEFPWMACFENHWAAKCLLGKHINSKAYDFQKQARRHVLPWEKEVGQPSPVEQEEGEEDEEMESEEVEDTQGGEESKDEDSVDSSPSTLLRSYPTTQDLPPNPLRLLGSCRHDRPSRLAMGNPLPLSPYHRMGSPGSQSVPLRRQPLAKARFKRLLESGPEDGGSRRRKSSRIRGNRWQRGPLRSARPRQGRRRRLHRGECRKRRRRGWGLIVDLGVFFVFLFFSLMGI